MEIVDATLTPEQRNRVVELIQEYGAPVGEFEFAVAPNEEWRDMAMRPSLFHVTTLRHKPTNYYCIFGAYEMTVDPGIKKKVEVTRHKDDWQVKLDVCGKWLVDVKINSEAPDLFQSLLSASQIHLEQAKTVAEKLTGGYVNQQIKRLEDAARNDPELAIGTAKEFLETLCRTLLTERSIAFSKDEDLAGLVRLTIRSVKVVPGGLTAPTIEKPITVLLNNLGSIANQLAEIRNAYGTGHGKSVEHVGLLERHAMLSVGAAVTLAVFLFHSHEAE